MGHLDKKEGNHMVSPSRLSEVVQEHVRFATMAMPDESDWLVVKRHLLTTLSPKDRSNFTRRDDKTKKHGLHNSFEQEIRKSLIGS